MNAPTDLSMKTDEVLRVELEVFDGNIAIWMTPSMRWSNAAPEIN